MKSRTDWQDGHDSRELREEYRRADKKHKKRLLNEARRRTHLNRKVLIRKLGHPARVRTSRTRPPREATCGLEVLATLVQVWQIFDYPCGQRLAPVLRCELERLRKAKDLHCNAEVAEKLVSRPNGNVEVYWREMEICAHATRERTQAAPQFTRLCPAAWKL